MHCCGTQTHSSDVVELCAGERPLGPSTKSQRFRMSSVSLWLAKAELRKIKISPDRVSAAEHLLQCLRLSAETSKLHLNPRGCLRVCLLIVTFLQQSCMCFSKLITRHLPQCCKVQCKPSDPALTWKNWTYQERRSIGRKTRARETNQTVLELLVNPVANKTDKKRSALHGRPNMVCG